VLPLDVGGAVGLALLLANGVEHELVQVLVVRDKCAELSEEGIQSGRSSGVHGASAREEDTVEDAEYASGGLVDGHDDVTTTLSLCVMWRSTCTTMNALAE
jgi:hypothetical protein